MEHFIPIFIKNSHIRCVIVGAGKVAARKTLFLLNHGIRPDIIAPEACAEMISIIETNQLDWKKRVFLTHDTNLYNMVFAATSSIEVNGAIKNQLAANVLFNDISNYEEGNFIVPATITRGDVQIAISTSGKAPFLTKYLRKYINEFLPDFPTEKMKELAQIRKDIITNSKGDETLKKQKFEQELKPLISDLFKRD